MLGAIHGILMVLARSGVYGDITDLDLPCISLWINETENVEILTIAEAVSVPSYDVLFPVEAAGQCPLPPLLDHGVGIGSTRHDDLRHGISISQRSASANRSDIDV